MLNKNHFLQTNTFYQNLKDNTLKTLIQFHIQDYVTVYIRTILNVIFEDAVNDEIIDFNPVRRVAKLPMQVPTKVNPFSLDEIKLILQNAEG